MLWLTQHSGLLACRFFLGLFEGGLLGGMILYLSMYSSNLGKLSAEPAITVCRFYRRHELLFRMGLFYCATPLSGAFGGLLATGLAEIKFNGYNRRRHLALVGDTADSTRLALDFYR